MNKRNYQRELDACIARHQAAGERPTLLLHACCAPCSSYVLEYLSNYFSVTLLFYNPNISPAAEYDKRAAELARLIKEMPLSSPVQIASCSYDAAEFFDAVKGLEREPEGGARCTVCYELRLRAAAIYAKEHGFDYFTTTLSISPLKDAVRLNTIGEALGKELGVSYLCSDFKKKEGYKRSIVLSNTYHLYRQDYCGCIFSKQQKM